MRLGGILLCFVVHEKIVVEEAKKVVNYSS